jgi:HNH endonuclease
MVAGERPHVTLTMAASELGLAAAGKDDDAASPGELDHAGAVSRHTARRLTCDASVMRVVMAGRSEPIDVGQRMKVVPLAMRRAVVVRDRTCRFPGCDRPHPWCDAHHVVHWADGGSTATSNLILLCRHHHRLIHRPNGFRIELADGRVRFRRPDGSLLDGRAPPL